jgi:hypothetical protein
MKYLSSFFIVLLMIGCSNQMPQEKTPKFTPPEDGKITKERAEVYVLASGYLMDAIMKHEKDMRGFAERYNLKEDLSELSDSLYCEEHPEIVKAWERIQKRWREYELEAYKKAGISEEEFNWIGGALADTVNREIQVWIQKKLEELHKK